MGTKTELRNSPDDLDAILGSMVYSEDQFPLTEAQLERFRCAEEALELLEEHNGNKTMVVSAFMTRPTRKLNRTDAYRACNDAQVLFGFITTFDYSFELLLKKNRMEKAISILKDKGDYKTAALMEKEHTQVLEYLRLENERRRPDDMKELEFVFHSDFKQLGWTDESWTAANEKINLEIIPKKMRQYKGNPTDVEIQSAG